MLMFHYMAIDPLTGFNILNKFLRPLRIPVNVESDYLRPFMKIILGRQLNMLFRSLQKKDAVIAFEDLNRFKEEELITLCFKRGINVEQKTNDMLGDLKLWLSISNLRDVPPSLLLFAMMREFVQNTFEVDEFDTQEDILRRSELDTFQLEKMRIFEKTFGINGLEKLVETVQSNLENVHDYNPNEDKFNFDKADLKSTLKSLKEFKTRHNAIYYRIQETYDIGAKLQYFAQEQLIIDYHFRGEQAKFEEEYP